MGLFSSIKKSRDINKKAEWKHGMQNVVVELEDDHMKIYSATASDVVFYQDIVSVEVSPMTINITTKGKHYSLVSKGLRGGTEKANQLQADLLSKMREYKNQ